MCGRYSLACIDNLCGRFRVIDPTIGFRSHFNIAPGSTNPVIMVHERAEAVMMQWGLVPHWAKDVAAWPSLFRLPVMWGQLVPHSAKDILPANRPFNARAENLTENKMFRELLRGNRCLVPASGFFEWKHEGGRKVPFYIHVKDDPVFGFAGLYDIWHNPAGAMLYTYTIITTTANALVAPIHDRMPVILRQDDEMRWLSRDALSADEMQRIFAPYPAEGMEAYPVSERVNRTDVDDEKVIERLKGL